MSDGVSWKTHRFLGCALALVLCCAPAATAGSHSFPPPVAYSVVRHVIYTTGTPVRQAHDPNLQAEAGFFDFV